MSECQLTLPLDRDSRGRGLWCVEHRDWATPEDQVCRTGRAEAVVERLTTALAERDRRIEKALAYCDDWKPIAFAWSIQRILRGES